MVSIPPKHTPSSTGFVSYCSLPLSLPGEGHRPRQLERSRERLGNGEQQPRHLGHSEAGATIGEGGREPAEERRCGDRYRRGAGEADSPAATARDNRR